MGLAICLSGCFSAPPQIISLEPNRGSSSVPADAPVRVLFDKTVVRSSVAGRFSVDPPLPGCDLDAVFAAPSTGPCWIHWLAGDQGFELIHQGSVLAAAQRYVFTLSGGFADVAGDVNGLDHHWDLTAAAAPRVVAVSPGDGSTAVPIDSPLAVAFSGPMDAPSTAGAITLQPPVAGTRVFRNLKDRTRFVILPGQLLDPGVAYTIAVGPAARGEDNQAVAAPLAARFLTSSRLGTAHAVVLAGRPTEGSTEVLLPALAPASPGEPVVAALVMRAARCSAPRCGSVAAQSPLETYTEAAVAVDAAHLAVVVNELSGPAPVSSLQVIDTATNAEVGHFAGGDRPSWSPSGTLLAFASGGDVEVFNTLTGRVIAVATAIKLVAVPVWSGNSTLVLSAAADAGSPAGVELVDLGLGASYDLPASPAGAVAAAVSPSGKQLAVSSDGGVLVLPVAGAGGGPQRVPGRLDGLGFSGEGTLIAVSHATDAEQLVRINLAGGDRTTIPLAVGLPDLGTVRFAADGRRLAFLSVDDTGVTQAYVANADGTGPVPLTHLQPDDVQAQSVDFAT